jgi:bifunctional DNase/RNase
LMYAYNISLLRVVIYKMEKEVFYSELIFKDKDDIEIKIDSRTSDAVALAVRYQSPIYTTEEIMGATSVFFEDDSPDDIKYNEQDSDEDEDDEDVDLELEEEFEIELESYESLNENELETQLEKAIKEEDYEKALIIKEEIKKRGEK